MFASFVSEAVKRRRRFLLKCDCVGETVTGNQSSVHVSVHETEQRRRAAELSQEVQISCDQAVGGA